MESFIRWASGNNRPILMIPGPTELPWPVIQAMSQPPMVQYDQNFDLNILEPTTLALRQVFQTTDGEVIIMPGSGRTALETSAISLVEPGDRAVVIVAGQFGVLMREIMSRVGAQVTEFPVEWGRPLDLRHLELEEATQEALMSPADEDLRTLRRAAHLEHVSLDVLAQAVVLHGRLLGRGQDGVDAVGLAPDVEDDGPRFDPAHGACGDLTLEVGELAEDLLALRLAQALQDDLLGGLGVDAAE